MTTKRASVESTADAYLELLAARGVGYFFPNSGTDFAPLIDPYARRLAQGLPAPRPMTIPPEVPAVGMAHGYALLTGRPQVVMVHVIVGAGNAVGGIINASRSNVPILFSAGRNPLTESGLHGSRNRPIHWAQESFDQAGMIREYVKWDCELRRGAVSRRRRLHRGGRVRRAVVPGAQGAAPRDEDRPDRGGSALRALPDPRVPGRFRAVGHGQIEPGRARRRRPEGCRWPCRRRADAALARRASAAARGVGGDRAEGSERAAARDGVGLEVRRRPG